MNDLQTAKLGQLLNSLKTGLNPRDNFKLNTPDAENWYITVRELNGLGVDFLSQTDKVNNHGLKLINNRSNLEVGDVLFSGTGTIGKTAIIDKHPTNWNIKEGVYALKPKKDRLESYYLMYLLKHLNKLNVFNKISAGSTVFSVPMKSLEDLKIQIHKLPEQIKISNVLKTLDFKIELNNRINAELEAMAKTLYDYWFVQFDFPDKKGKPYKTSGGKMVWNEELKREIPEGWEVKELQEITAVSNESVNPMDFPDKEFKYYSIPGFDESGTFKIEKGIEIRSNKYSIKNTDVLVSKLNPWFSRVIYSTDDSDLISSTEFVVWRTENIAIKNYMYMIARDASFVTFCTKSASGTSNSHKRVNPTVMMKYQIVFNVAIATLFGNTLGGAIKLLAKNKIENQKLTELRDWLLPMLMNGQVKVK